MSNNANLQNSDIDFVVLWVDGSDPEWRAKKQRYAHEQIRCLFDPKREMTGEVRSRDWGIFKYWFRAVEKYAPWVRKVHFVSSGQVPEWMNLACPKLHYVNDEDYMPKEWLPSFNSTALELNLFRIEDLAEKFVYFNDDMFLNAPVKPTDFFVNDLPCDCAILEPMPITQDGYSDLLLNIMRIIRHYAGFDAPFEKNLWKWLNPRYGTRMFKNLILWHWRTWMNFHDPHICNAYLKSTFVEVWKKVPRFLEVTSADRFRNYYENVSHLLIRDWQFSSGKFCPRSPSFGECYGITTMRDAIEDIRTHKHKAICLNDGTDENVDFDVVRSQVQQAYQDVLPDKSMFEV